MSTPHLHPWSPVSRPGEGTALGWERTGRGGAQFFKHFRQFQCQHFALYGRTLGSGVCVCWGYKVPPSSCPLALCTCLHLYTPAAPCVWGLPVSHSSSSAVSPTRLLASHSQLSEHRVMDTGGCSPWPLTHRVLSPHPARKEDGDTSSRTLRHSLDPGETDVPTFSMTGIPKESKSWGEDSSPRPALPPGPPGIRIYQLITSITHPTISFSQFYRDKTKAVLCPGSGPGHERTRTGTDTVGTSD